MFSHICILNSSLPLYICFCLGAGQSALTTGIDWTSCVKPTILELTDRSMYRIQIKLLNIHTNGPESRVLWFPVVTSLLQNCCRTPTPAGFNLSNFIHFGLGLLQWSRDPLKFEFRMNHYNMVALVIHLTKQVEILNNPYDFKNRGSVFSLN